MDFDPSDSNYPRGHQSKKFGVEPKTVQKVGLRTQAFAILLVAVLISLGIYGPIDPASPVANFNVILWVGMLYTVMQMVWFQYSIRYLREQGKLQLKATPEAVAAWTLGMTLFAYIPLIYCLFLVMNASERLSATEHRSRSAALIWIVGALLLASVPLDIVGALTNQPIVIGLAELLTALGLFFVIPIIRIVTNRIQLVPSIHIQNSSENAIPPRTSSEP